ncbi:UNVERIFIED_ORG: hypothetical protein J2791_001130 [Burkholderia contaminans]|nr:hypothetical protein [Burkholderia contaminans]
MNLFRDNESGGERKGGAAAGTLRSAKRTTHGRRDGDAGALYRAVAPARRHAAPGRAAVAPCRATLAPCR